MSTQQIFLDHSCFIVEKHTSELYTEILKNLISRKQLTKTIENSIADLSTEKTDNKNG